MPTLTESALRDWSFWAAGELVAAAADELWEYIPARAAKLAEEDMRLEATVESAMERVYNSLFSDDALAAKAGKLGELIFGRWKLDPSVQAYMKEMLEAYLEVRCFKCERRLSGADEVTPT